MSRIAQQNELFCASHPWLNRATAILLLWIATPMRHRSCFSCHWSDVVILMMETHSLQDTTKEEITTRRTRKEKGHVISAMERFR